MSRLFVTYRKYLWILMLLIALSVGFDSVTAQDTDTEEDEVTTIPYADVIIQMLDFTAQTTGDCVLPCFNDIRPDETTYDEIVERTYLLFDGDESILAEFDSPFEREDGLIAYTFLFNNLDITGSFYLSFLFLSDNETLHRFYARLNHPENWLEATNLDIGEILAVLGEPDEIYLSISGSQPPYFQIVLSYETLGTLLRYIYFFDPEQLTQGEEPIPLCGSWSTTFSIDVWIQAVDEESYDALLDENLRLSESENAQAIVYRAFWPLERITNWNIEDLTHFLIENPDWCFDALSYNELWEAGYSY